MNTAMRPLASWTINPNHSPGLMGLVVVVVEIIATVVVVTGVVATVGTYRVAKKPGDYLPGPLILLLGLLIGWFGFWLI